MADVFISYKSERRTAAEHLADILEDHGYSVWFDYALATGASFSDQIERELKAAKCVIVLWCRLSVKSDWVKREASYAQNLGKICPVFIENVELPLQFHDEHTIDLANWDGAPQSGQPNRLLDEIAKHTGKAPNANVRALERMWKAWRYDGSLPLSKLRLGTPIAEQAGEPNFGSDPLTGAEPDNAASTKQKTAQVKSVIVPSNTKGAAQSADSSASKTWSQIKDSEDPLVLQDFLETFPEAPESIQCSRRLAELENRNEAKALIQERIKAFEALPRDGFNVTTFDEFIRQFEGTDEAFKARGLRRECQSRLDNAIPVWEQEAAVQVLTNTPIPTERIPFIETLIVAGRDAELFRSLEMTGTDLEKFYVDPTAFYNSRRLILEDLTPVASLRSLKKLYCFSTKISNLAPIGGLTEMQELYFSDTNVSDLSPLSRLTQLSKLDCSNTPVESLVPLSNLRNLNWLDLRGTKVENFEPIKHVPQAILPVGKTRERIMNSQAPLRDAGSQISYDTLMQFKSSKPLN